VDVVGAEGHLAADVEGLTIYQTRDHGGYLIASSQGDDTFVVYRREPPNAYLLTFEIAAGNGIDGVTSTDGIDVANLGLGDSFPGGLFVAQDNANPGGNQNFKLVSWDAIARTAIPRLITDPAWDPRLVSGSPIGIDDLAPASPSTGRLVRCEVQPNPFGRDASVILAVPGQERVTVQVFNLLGQRVATLHDGVLATAGEHRFTFTGRDLPSGLYLCQARGESFSALRKVMLVK
jgi:hypothetical protein